MLKSMDPTPKVLALEGSRSLITVFEDILFSTTMLPQVLIEHTLHTLTQSVPYGHYEDKCNIRTTRPPLTEVRLQNIDPPNKKHTLDSSGCFFLFFGLHAAFDHHTLLYYIYYITSNTPEIPDSIYEDESQSITCPPLRLQSMDPPSQLHALC